MAQGSKKDRLLYAYNYLYDHGRVHTVTDLADKMGRARPGVSKAMSGTSGYLNDRFLKAFAKTFTEISEEWLLYGTGSMLTTGEKLPVEKMNEENKFIFEVDKGSLINAALAAKDETIKAKDETIAGLRETIEALRTENELLKKRVAVLQSGDAIRGYQFPVGVAENNEDVRSHG